MNPRTRALKRKGRGAAPYRTGTDRAVAVLRGSPKVVGGETRWASVGHTNKLRILKVFWTVRHEDKVRVITAFDASRSHACEYLRGEGGVMKRLVVPKFETEAEEAQWWYDNRDAVDKNFVEAIKNGTIHRGGPAALLRETRMVQVRLPNTDLDRIEKLAGEKGFTSIQGCISALLHDALDREDAKKAKKRKSA